MTLRRALLGSAIFTAIAVAGCGGHADVNAPPWVLSMARQEAAKMGETDPDVTFAACRPATCSVRMNGSFRCSDCPRPPGQPDPHGTRLSLDVDLKSRVITTREVGPGE